MKTIVKCCLAVALGFAVAGCSKNSKESSRESRASNIEDGGHKGVLLWKDGPYWAETNIGAENPWGYGYHFWWGDTIGYMYVNDAWIASDGSSFSFSFERKKVPTYSKDTSTLRKEGWITAEGVLAPEHDAAHVHWGGAWRMPTKQELKDLCDKCDWEWTTLNDVKGYVVRGRGDYASTSIFLSCAGYGARGLGLSFAEGCYWSSVPNSDDRGGAWSVGFNDSRGTFNAHRFWGLSVRPVQGATK